jgi:hypothetical protein
VRSLTDIGGLRVTYNAPKGPLQCKRQRFGHSQRVWPAGTRTHPRRVSLQSSSLSDAATEVTTQPTIVVAVTGKRQRRLLQSERKGSAAEKIESARACQRTDQHQLSLLPNRRNWIMAGTTLLEVVASSRLRLRPSQTPHHPTQEERPSGRLPQRATSVSPLVLKYRWIPIHPDPSD